VVVCDGFVGNIALKTSEGVTKLISHFIKEAFNSNWLTKFSALVAMPVLKRLAASLDPDCYNGASLIGLQGTVIKSHGGANILGFTNAINEAILEVEKDVPNKIGAEISAILTERQVLGASQN